MCDRWQPNYKKQLFKANGWTVFPETPDHFPILLHQTFYVVENELHEPSIFFSLETWLCDQNYIQT